MLHRLRMSNYNVLLACPNTATGILCGVATIIWPWDALIKGEDFSQKRFNHSPDGPIGSWYGHFKGALDDPFLETEPMESIEVPSASKHCAILSDSMHCSVPKYVISAIQEALSLNPEGMNLSELRMDLQKNNLHLGNDFFGHKRFSALIQSLLDIVKFVKPPPGKDQLDVTFVNKRLMRPGEQTYKTPCPAQCNIKEAKFIRTEHPSFQSIERTHSSQSMDVNQNFPETVNMNPPTLAVSSSPSDAVSEDRKKWPTVDVNPKSESSADNRQLDGRTTLETPSPAVMENVDNKYGLLKRIWILSNSPANAKYEDSRDHESTSAEVVDELRTPLQEHSADHHRKFLKRFNKNSHSDGSDGTAAASANSSILSDDDHLEKIRRDTSLLDHSEQNSEPASLPMSEAVEKDDTSKMFRGLFSKQNTVDEASTSTCVSGQEMTNVIFIKSYFWDILEQQLSKPLGSEIISKAKTREELVSGLQKLCWPLSVLLDKDLHHLVHLLVSEKKWIEEIPSGQFPFCVNLPRRQTCVPSNSSKHSGLSSIFSNVKPLQQGKYANFNSKTNRHLNREEILSHCHKLLKELLSQYEHGFNIGIFKHRFVKKHGYDLDLEKLGYTDLESLLQVMPDVRVKFPRVIPAENGNEQGSSKGNGNQNNGDISEELGPVSATRETTAGADEEMCYCPPTPSDDEFSDNDCPADQQPRKHAEQSSLLQIIDLWNSSNDGGSRIDIDGLVECSPCNIDNSISGSARRPARLSPKQYFVVLNSEKGQGNDKLVECILGSLQKAQG